MGKINLELPNFNYKNYHWEKEDNVTSYGRAKEFEEQNEKYRKVGYTQYNTMYYRAFNVDDDVHKFCETLFPRYSVGIMKQPPGQTLPLHDDTFYMFAKLNKIDSNDCIRVNVFLEDWQNGHYFEINGNPVLQWNKGDAIIIKRNELHLSGNMGMADKYTMQITGVLNEFKRS